MDTKEGMFNDTRTILDKLEKMHLTWDGDGDTFDWFRFDYSFDFAKALAKEIPDIIKIAQLILVDAGINEVKIKVE